MDTYTTHIKSKNSWFDLNLGEVWQYKDLIFLFAKRSLVAEYKQTVLGPIWNVLTPLCTVFVQAMVFGNMAGLADDGVPMFVFYMCSNIMWAFFSASLKKTANTFKGNAHVMGKVYYPRLCSPLASLLLNFWKTLIKVGLLIIIMLIYFFRGTTFSLGPKLLLTPLFFIQAAMLGMGFGVIVASCTTKYRDLSILVGFGMSIWQYSTPVIYTEAKIPAQYLRYYMLNPMASVMCNWRNAVLGTGTFYGRYWIISWMVTIIVFLIGVLLFNRVEKTFMDTI